MMLLKKKKKLRLGKIVFEIKEIKYYNILIWSDFEMRYINQDTTVADEQKIENLVKRFEWKWNFNNIFSAILISIIVIYKLFKLVKIWFNKKYSFIFFREPHYDYFIKYSIENSFIFNINCSNLYDKFNIFIVNTLTDLCLYFDILF
jgi:hypothetical protein